MGDMSKCATKWEPCSKEEYHKIYNDKLGVYSSYTNPDGNDGLSSQPQLFTTWGDDEKELIKCIGTRDRDYEPNTWNWDWKHWIAVEWEAEED